jgi:tRNA threonylcarbamoyladenosine biosynthesis protein TsaB
MMTWLALDTSTDIATVALKHLGQVHQREVQGVATHAQSILPMIDELLQEAGIELSMLQGIIVGKGPGSFTGLRVACAVVKGLAIVHDIPVYPVSTLLMMAWQAQSFPVLAVMDARMQQVYWAYYGQQEDKPKEQVSCLSDVIALSTNATLVTYKIDEYHDKMPEALMKLKRLEARPDASVMIEMVEANLIEAIDAIALEPHYVRDQVTQGGKNG